MHHIYQQQHAPAIMVYAGGLHCAAICPMLEKLGYQQVDEYKDGVIKLLYFHDIELERSINLEYYFSHFSNGPCLLTPEDVWTIDRDIPIMLDDNINWQDESGKTALIHAAQRNFQKMFNYLIQQKDIDVTMIDHERKSARDYALEHFEAAFVKKAFEQARNPSNQGQWSRDQLAW